MKNKILVNTSFAADKWGAVPCLLLEHRVSLLCCPPPPLLSSLPCSHFILHPCSNLFGGSIFWRTEAWWFYNVAGHGGTQLPAFYTVTHLADCSSPYIQQWFHNKHNRNFSNHMDIATLISVFLLVVVALGILSLSLGLPRPCSGNLCI